VYVGARLATGRKASHFNIRRKAVLPPVELLRSVSAARRAIVGPRSCLPSPTSCACVGIRAAGRAVESTSGRAGRAMGSPGDASRRGSGHADRPLDIERPFGIIPPAPGR
jgi:hypothetical protein